MVIASASTTIIIIGPYLYCHNWRAQRQSGLTHEKYISTYQTGTTLIMCFRSCWCFCTFPFTVCYLIFLDFQAISHPQFMGYSTLALTVALVTPNKPNSCCVLAAVTYTRNWHRPRGQSLLASTPVPRYVYVYIIMVIFPITEVIRHC